MPVVTVRMTASHSAVSATQSWCSKVGSSARPTATSCTTVFTFAHQLAGTESPMRPQ